MTKNSASRFYERTGWIHIPKPIDNEPTLLQVDHIASIEPDGMGGSTITMRHGREIQTPLAPEDVRAKFTPTPPQP